MDNQLTLKLNNLGIYDIETRNLNSLRWQLEDMLEAALSNTRPVMKNYNQDIIITKEENNLCWQIIDTYSSLMDYIEKELDKKLQ
jgi:hypothetical protein